MADMKNTTQKGTKNWPASAGQNIAVNENEWILFYFISRNKLYLSEIKKDYKPRVKKDNTA